VSMGLASAGLVSMGLSSWGQHSMSLMESHGSHRHP